MDMNSQRHHYYILQRWGVQEASIFDVQVKAGDLGLWGTAILSLYLGIYEITALQPGGMCKRVGLT
jgi:hypothetical protein